jgi:hypothetical protein
MRGAAKSKVREDKEFSESEDSSIESLDTLGSKLEGDLDQLKGVLYKNGVVPP